MPFKEFEVDGVGRVKIYKRRGSRSLKLSVPEAGLVRVTIPKWAPYAAGLTFVTSKREWILAHAAAPQATLLHGQQIGKTHQLMFRPQDAIGVKTSVQKEKIIVSFCASYDIADMAVQTAAQRACWRALRRQAVHLFDRRLQELALQNGFQYRSLAIKRLKSRWGSCDSHGNIVLNLFLVQLPWELIDYVMVHELSHTVALNHGETFWKRFETAMPDARMRQKAMRAYRPTLLVADGTSVMA